MSALPKLNDWGMEIAPTTRRARRRMYLPAAIEAAETKLVRLYQEASQIGLNIGTLEASHRNGDLIASEFLKRLGYFR